MSLSHLAQRSVLALAVLCLVGVALPARAQIMTDQLISGALGASANLGSAVQKMDVSAILERLRMQGYTDVQVDQTNPREAIAMNPAGLRVKLILDPTTGQIISAVPQ